MSSTSASGRRSSARRGSSRDPGPARFAFGDRYTSRRCSVAPRSPRPRAERSKSCKSCSNPQASPCNRLRFSEVGQPDVENLYARIGSAAPHLVFAGHTDRRAAGRSGVVALPAVLGRGWRTGKVWGRGACDMKGGVAAAGRGRPGPSRAGRATPRFDLLPDHGRRRRPGRQRHAETARLGPGPRRVLPDPLRPRRADQPRPPRRDDQDRAARFADR